MKKIDDGLFWSLFSLACVCIILYMAFDFRNAVLTAVESMELSKCVSICNEVNSKMFGSGWSNLTIPIYNDGSSGGGGASGEWNETFKH